MAERWRGRWIWEGARRRYGNVLTGRAGKAADTDLFDRYKCFRRTVELGSRPRSATLRITADSRYVAWVNGEEVCRGPIRSNPRRLHYDEVEITNHLREGRNSIAVLARFYGYPTAWWIPAPSIPSMGAGVLVAEARIDTDHVVSDGSWKASAGEAWTPQAPRGLGGSLAEVHDARGLDPGWKDPDFDDSSWGAAWVLDVVHVGASGEHRPPTLPYGALLPRPIPALAGDTKDSRVVSVTAVHGGPPSDYPVLQVDLDEGSEPLATQPSGPGTEGAAGGRLPGAAMPIALECGAEEVLLVTVDFGEVVAGTLLLDLESPAGTRIDVSCAESLTPAGKLSRLFQETGFRYVTRGGRDAFETFDPIGTRFARLAIRSSGSEGHDGASGVGGVGGGGGGGGVGGGGRPIVLRRLAVHERLYPRPPGPYFECSDAALNEIFRIGLRTVDLCAQDAYIDCPTREQRAWTGDSVVHQQVHLATNPDWGLAIRHARLAASPRPDGMLPMVAAGMPEAEDGSYIPDWALHWVRSVHNLMRWTGDRDLVSSLAPTVENLLRWFLPFQEGDGLLGNVCGWTLIDWSDVHTLGTSSALNALWARALRDYAQISVWLGDNGRSAWAASVLSEVERGFERFWDPDRGVYVDQIRDGDARPAVSQHANAAAICAGLVAEGRLLPLIDTITDKRRLIRVSSAMEAMAREDSGAVADVLLFRGLPEPSWDVERRIVEAQPFFRYVVHDAVAVAGRAEQVVELCRDWTVFTDNGETTWPETWHGGTHCHGWSSTPTRDLIVYTLGISPDTPGFAAVRVSPRLGPLEWAHGSAPTPWGLVEVSVEDDKVEVDSPVPVTLDLSGGRSRQLPSGRHEVAAARHELGATDRRELI